MTFFKSGFNFTTYTIVILTNKEVLQVENKVNATITDDTAAQIHGAITTIASNLPYLIDLTPDQKKALTKFVDKSVAFVSKALEYAQQYHDALPRSLNIGEIASDVTLYSQLFSLIQPMRVLMDKLEDTLAQVESEAYSSALVVYKNLKANHTMFDGAENVLDELGRRFIQKALVIDEKEVATPSAK